MGPMLLQGERCNSWKIGSMVLFMPTHDGNDKINKFNNFTSRNPGKQ
jgi:hypothetical protein